MTLFRLVSREIHHRRGNFLLSVLGVAFAVLGIFAVAALLKTHQSHAKAVLEEMRENMKGDMVRLEDEVRKSMKGLGFNIFIFPAGQEMSEVYAEGFASETMPEGYVDQLAQSNIVTVNHLLPSLTKKVQWEGLGGRTIIVIGIRGEVPIAHRDQKKPLLEPVEKGSLVLGYELHRGADLKEGDETTLLGGKFTIARIHSERGNRDDITIWMNLREAQELLGEEGRINAIQALECNCATIDRLGEIRKELMSILPDTQIIETRSTALARAEARNLAKETAEKRIADTERELVTLGRERDRFAGIILPVATIGGMIWIALLAFINVRERVGEIGILRAIGVKSRVIFSAILLRAGLAGIIGASSGVVGFLALHPIVREKWFHSEPIADLLSASTWAFASIAAFLFATVAAWLPALVASQKDPAEILRHD